MPRYLVVRKFEVDSDEMPQVGRRSRVAIEDNFPQIVWEHSHVTVDDDGLVRTYCVYDAPDEETVREHSRVLGQHQVETIQEIAGDVTPADFPG
jgi:Nickel responsive protein SCO4226-like